MDECKPLVLGGAFSGRGSQQPVKSTLLDREAGAAGAAAVAGMPGVAGVVDATAVAAAAAAAVAAAAAAAAAARRTLASGLQIIVAEDSVGPLPDIARHVTHHISTLVH